MSAHLNHLIALVIITVSVFIVGFSLALPFIGCLRRYSVPLSIGDVCVLASVNGIAAITFVGLALGYAGFFSIFRVSLASLTVAAAFLIRYRSEVRRLLPMDLSRAEVVAFALGLLVVVYAVLMRSHEIAGMRDQGVYTATGIQLARTGSFFWRDPLIAKCGFEPVAHLFEDIGDILQGRPRYLRFAGYYLDPPEKGRVIPQFLHGYEVWIGLAYAAGGPQATQCVNGLFSALSVFAFFLVIRRLWDPHVALGASFLLATSLPQLWFARFPSNEPLLQLLIWGVILAYVLSWELRTTSSPAGISRFQMVPFLLPLAAAATVKFAFWPLLGIFAFEVGIASRLPRVFLQTRQVLFGLVGISFFAFLHALVFARFYLYGSWNFTVRKLGISYEMFPIVFVSAIAAAYCLGAVLAEYREILARWWSRIHRHAIWFFVAGIVTVYCYQDYMFAKHPPLDVWSEQTNLYEFAQYYGPLGFCFAIAGFALWLRQGAKHPATRLLLLLALAASMFLVKRNLDAIHPWGSRRWLPVLVPVMALASAIAVHSLSRLLFLRWGRVVQCALLLIISIAQMKQAPTLLTVSNYRGAIPQVDQWTRFLRADDFVLFAPTAVVAQYGPYLAARFDIQGYVQKNAPEFWQKTRLIATDSALSPSRSIYVTDEDLSLSGAGFARLLGTKELNYLVVVEEVHRLPVKPIHVQQTIRFYELDWATMPNDWWTGWKPRLVPSPRPLPVVLPMDTKAEPYLAQGFYDPTFQSDGRAYRWTNGNARIALGQLLQFPLPKRPIRLTLVAHSGRNNESVDVHWYLDFEKPDRQRKVGLTTATPDWTESTVEIPAELLKPDSTLELQSLRPPVPPAFPAGRLGIRILELRID